MKIITLTSLAALAVALSSGAAFADRHGGSHGGGGRSGGGRSSGSVIHEQRGGGNWNHSGGVTVRSMGRENHVHYNTNRVYRGGYRSSFVRRPIYVRRPVIRERYFDFRIRPRIIVEDYAPMAGYYWVSGQWSWDGYEWMWQPGHYEPDASYDAGYYVE
jgi:hypothetical protein